MPEALSVHMEVVLYSLGLVSEWVAVVAAFGAAVFWSMSALVKTPHQSKGPVGLGEIATAIAKQSRFSALGAASAAASAVAQGVHVLLG